MDFKLKDKENNIMTENKKVLQGGKLAGGNPKNKRVDNDFYSTNPKAVEMLFNNYDWFAQTNLEPCVGDGNIANVVSNYFTNKRDVDGVDLIDRGYEGAIIHDYLTYETDKKYEGIITNPPFSLAKEFIEKSITLMDDNAQMAMFLKIQFLEGEKRREFFKQYPPKYVYVFTKRMATWNDGKSTDENGKKWSTTMCHAWFVWEKENGEMSKTEPIIRWL